MREFVLPGLPQASIKVKSHASALVTEVGGKQHRLRDVRLTGDFYRGEASAQQAAESLIHATENDDVAALLSILGPQTKDLLDTGDAVADKKHRGNFCRDLQSGWKLTPDPVRPETFILLIGANDDSNRGATVGGRPGARRHNDAEIGRFTPQTRDNKAVDASARRFQNERDPWEVPWRRAGRTRS